MQNVNKNIFREYDIRGREGEGELSAECMELLGKACAIYFQKYNIDAAIVGRDARITSEEYQKALIKGLLYSGINVINIGTVLTPMTYWAQYRFKIKGAVMVTASHNPKGWNGVKVASNFSETLSGAEIQELYNIMQVGQFYESEIQGKETRENIKEEYIKDLTSRVAIKKPFKIVVNTGNGTAGLVALDLIKALGIKIIEHLTNLDSNYPNYTPNPANSEMLEDTAGVVLENKADLGFAFDGDGDRLGLVDEKGNIVWPDQYLIFLAQLLLKEQKDITVICDIKSTQALFDALNPLGVKVILAPTGHSNIKAVMAKEKADLAGELSGHVFIKHGYYGFDDAQFAALKLLEYFSETNKPVSELLASLPKYVSSPGYIVETPDDKKFDIVVKVREEFKKDNYKVIEIDGARVNFDELDGWGLIRASNTIPALTLRFEAKTEGNLEKIKSIFRKKLEKYDFISKDWKTG